jgi:hypothetical protein
MMKFLSLSLVALLLAFPMGCGKYTSNIKIDGVKGPTFSNDGNFGVMSMTFENVSMTGATIHYAIPHLPNSSVDIYGLGENLGTNFDLRISQEDLNDLLERIAQGLHLEPRMLPGDRPLPGVAGGKLQSVLFDLGSFKDITVYVGDKNFGIFVPGPINIGPAIATFRLFIAKKRAGNLSLVGPDQNGENAGVLLLFDITAPAVQTWLKRILPPVRR